MSGYRKINNRRPTIVRADVSYYSKGIRRQLRIAYPADAEERIGEPAKWKILFQNDKCKLFRAYATRDTNYTNNGEAVYFLRFRDGRKIRIYKDDFAKDLGRKLNMAIWADLYPEFVKSRRKKKADH